MLSRIVRSEDYKGHREMIAAWPRVLEKHPRAELWIAGEGDLMNDLESMARSRGLSERIRLLGWVSEREKQELLRRSCCLALPSRGEGFGLVYLEAMRAGRPCLVSTLDAGREVVGPPDTGLAADMDNQTHLADAVSMLLERDPQWELWAFKAKQRYNNRFTSAHFQKRLLEVVFST